MLSNQADPCDLYTPNSAYRIPMGIQVCRWVYLAWLYKYLSVIDDHKTDNHNTKRHSAIRLANVHRPYTRVHNNMLMPRMPKLTLDLLKNTFSCCCVFYYFFSNLSKINGVGGLVTEASCCTVPFQMKMFSYVFCQRTPPAALVWWSRRTIWSRW